MSEISTLDHAAKADYRLLLEQEYLARKQRNPMYSMRTFARHLGVSKTALCEVLARKRHLSRRNAQTISERLGLDVGQTEELIDAATRRPRQTRHEPDRYLEEDVFHAISAWYHYAILNLIKLPDHSSSPEWLAGRLGISVSEARAAVFRLARLGMIEEVGGKLRRLVGSLETTKDIPSAAIRSYHRQNMNLADRSLDRDPVELREFGSVTVAVDAEKIGLAKIEIRKFRRKMAKILDASNPKDVYTLAIQFFPATQGENR